MTIEEIGPEAVTERIGGDDKFDLLDVRDGDAYADGHLPGAEHVTIEALEETVAEREWAEVVIVYCYVGETSIQAARLIEKYGDADRVISMAGGYEAWESPTAVEAN
mgnify:CR=1 FL=1